MQPVVQPVLQPVRQPVASCKRGITESPIKIFVRILKTATTVRNKQQHSDRINVSESMAACATKPDRHQTQSPFNGNQFIATTTTTKTTTTTINNYETETASIRIRFGVSLKATKTTRSLHAKRYTINRVQTDRLNTTAAQQPPPDYHVLSSEFQCVHICAFVTLTQSSSNSRVIFGEKSTLAKNQAVIKSKHLKFIVARPASRL